MTANQLKSLKCFEVLDFNNVIQKVTVKGKIFPILHLRNDKEENTKFWNLICKFTTLTDEVQRYAKKLLIKSDKLYEELVSKGEKVYVYDIYKYLDYGIMLALLPEAAKYKPDLVLNLETVVERLLQLSVPTAIMELQFRNMMAGIFSMSPVSYAVSSTGNLQKTKLLLDEIMQYSEDAEVTAWMWRKRSVFDYEKNLQNLELARNNFLYYRYSIMVDALLDTGKLVADKKIDMNNGLLYLKYMIQYKEICHSSFLSFVCCAFEVSYICFELNALPQAQYLLSAAQVILQQYTNDDKPGIYRKAEYEMALGNIKFAYCYLLLKWIFNFFGKCLGPSNTEKVNMNVDRIDELEVPAGKEVHRRPLKNVPEVHEVLMDATRMYKTVVELNLPDYPCKVACKEALDDAVKLTTILMKCMHEYHIVMRKGIVNTTT